jgi:nucleoside-diphosphate-sugar epimerase
VIVEKLVDRGWQVTSFARGSYPELEALGVVCHRGDLADADDVDVAVAGSDAVFHVAAKAGVWGPYREYERANIVGTDNVLAACRKHGVGRLVYTSTPSVVHAGDDIEGADESLPYPRKFHAHYPATKAVAEQRVLAASSPELATVALRPHLIWGPRDNHLVPRLLERQRSGRLKLVGSGDKLVDTVYVDNAADAHLAACDRLEPDAACAGRVYFISQGEPLPIREWINRILAAGGLGPVRRSVPAPVALFAGAVMEGLATITGQKEEPMLTRFLVRHLSTAHWYDLTAARRDLGYEPAISIDEGFERLAVWLSSR